MKTILVIPSLFPESETDYKGIFVKDYINSVKGEFNIVVFYIRLFGEKPGTYVQSEAFYRKHNIVLFRRSKINFLLRHILYAIWYLKAVRSLRKLKGIDLIHVHGGLFLNGLLGLIASRLMKIPVVYSEHMGGFDNEYKHFLPRAFGHVIFNRFDAVLIVSKKLKDGIERRGFRAKSLYVVYNPVDTDLFVPGAARTRNNLVYVGRFDKNKGALRVAEAFRIALAKNNELRLLMIGGGVDFNDVSKYISDHPDIKPFVDLKGFISKDSIREILQTSSILLAPSVFESFGIAVAEGMSCGLPVIIGKGTGPAEYVDEKSGIAVDPIDVNAIAEAILELNQNYIDYDGEYIRKRIIENFSFEVFGSRLTSIYNTVLNKSFQE